MGNRDPRTSFACSYQPSFWLKLGDWELSSGSPGIRAFGQGTLTLILKGEVSVQLTSLSLPVRTRLF